MTQCHDHDICPFSPELATIQNELKNINQQLGKGDARFTKMEEILGRLSSAEQQMIGGYRLFKMFIALLGIIAAFLAVPWISKLF